MDSIIVKDVLMIGTLVISFVLLKLMADWCEHQTERREE